MSFNPQVKGSAKSTFISSLVYDGHFIGVDTRGEQPILTENELILRANSRGPPALLFTTRFPPCHSKGQPPG